MKVFFTILFSILLFAFFDSCKKIENATCYDHVNNQGETGIDCGGPCAPCPSCFDRVMNQNETGMDCGGPCAPCPSCSDGILNQGETKIDCGGPCSPCASCSDGIRNQGETGVDCGGPCSPCSVPLPFIDILIGDYLVSGGYYYNGMGGSSSTNIARDTIHVYRIADSTVTVKSIYDSVYHYYRINSNLSYDTDSSAGNIQRFDSPSSDYHILNRLSFYKIDMDSICAYFGLNGISGSSYYNLTGRKMH